MLLLLVSNIAIRILLLLIIITITFLLVRQVFRDSEGIVLSITLSIIILSVFTIMAYIGISSSFSDLLTIVASFDL